MYSSKTKQQSSSKNLVHVVIYVEDKFSGIAFRLCHQIKPVKLQLTQAITLQWLSRLNIWANQQDKLSEAALEHSINACKREMMIGSRKEECMLHSIKCYLEKARRPVRINCSNSKPKKAKSSLSRDTNPACSDRMPSLYQLRHHHGLSNSCEHNIGFPYLPSSSRSSWGRPRACCRTRTRRAAPWRHRPSARASDAGWCRVARLPQENSFWVCLQISCQTGWSWPTFTCSGQRGLSSTKHEYRFDKKLGTRIDYFQNERSYD